MKTKFLREKFDGVKRQMEEKKKSVRRSESRKKWNGIEQVIRSSAQEKEKENPSIKNEFE